MRKMMNKVTGSMKAAAKKAVLLMKDTRGENYVDTASEDSDRRCTRSTSAGGTLHAVWRCGHAYPYTEDSGDVQLRRIVET